MNIDIDILAVVKAIAATPELVRQAKVKAKHEKQSEERLNTLVELLSDELEQVIPRSHPMFMPVLLSSVLHKVARLRMEKEEQEYNSSLDHFPSSW